VYQKLNILLRQQTNILFYNKDQVQNSNKIRIVRKTDAIYFRTKK